MKFSLAVEMERTPPDQDMRWAVCFLRSHMAGHAPASYYWFAKDVPFQIQFSMPAKTLSTT